MSNYDDPWGHAVRLFMNRLVLFIVLSLLLGMAVWKVSCAGSSLPA